jgi:hypothetical protein
MRPLPGQRNEELFALPQIAHTQNNAFVGVFYTRLVFRQMPFALIFMFLCFFCHIHFITLA